MIDRCVVISKEEEEKFAGSISGTLKGQSVQRQQRLKMFSTMSVLAMVLHKFSKSRYMLFEREKIIFRLNPCVCKCLHQGDDNKASDTYKRTPFGTCKCKLVRFFLGISILPIPSVYIRVCVCSYQKKIVS